LPIPTLPKAFIGEEGRDAERDEARNVSAEVGGKGIMLFDNFIDVLTDPGGERVIGDED
jgi:hypothetical protein